MDTLISFMIQDMKNVCIYLPQALAAGAVYVLVYVLFRRFGRHCNHGFQHLFLRTLFVIYAVMLVMIVFFSRETGSRQGVDLTFLGTWGITARAHSFVIENILLFIPFGILFPVWLPKGKRGYTVPAGCLCSIFIEYLQLRTGRGFCQLDDVVMNSLGTLVGFILMESGSFLFLNMKKHLWSK